MPLPKPPVTKGRGGDKPVKVTPSPASLKRNKSKQGKQQKPKLFVLDTNVLIDDPNCIFNFGENDVILPITTIDELDNLKGKLFEAREALRNIDGSGAGKDWKTLPSGGRIKVEISEEKYDTNDKTIVGVAYSHYKKSVTKTGLPRADAEYSQVILVTNDRGPAIRARALGLKTEKYKTNQVNIDEFLSNLPKSYIALEKGSEEYRAIYNNGFVKPYVPTYWKERGVKVNKAQELSIHYLFDTNTTLLSLLGEAGTGKTMTAVLAALKQVLDGKYEKLIITKPVVAVGGNDIGYLPGSKNRKMESWIKPFEDHINSYFKKEQEKLVNQKSFKPNSKKARKVGDGKVDVSQLRDKFDKTPRTDLNDAPKWNFNTLVSSGIIEVEAEAFIRGRSFENCIVIIDETQNVSPTSIRTWITRMGDNSKLVLIGDVSQIDEKYLSRNNNGLAYTAVKTADQPWAKAVHLTLGVRSVMSEWASKNM